jgi:hypothetical protein
MKGIEILEMRYTPSVSYRYKKIGAHVIKKFPQVRLPGERPLVVTCVEKIPEGYLEVSKTYNINGKWFVEFWFGPATPRAIEFARRVRGL